MNVDLASAEGAAVAHARSSGDIGTLMGRLIDHTTSAATVFLKSIRKKATAAAATALQAATTKGSVIAPPVPPVVRAKPAPAQPDAAAAPLFTQQPLTATAPAPRTRAKAKVIAKAVAPSAPIELPELAAVTTLAVSKGPRRKREEVQLRREEQQQKRP